MTIVPATSYSNCVAPPAERYAFFRFARRFDRLRRFLDKEPIARQIQALLPLATARVIELGAGTGVLTELLARSARAVTACDRSAKMLALARHALQELGFSNVEFIVADHRRVPLSDASADAVVSAFALDGLVYDSPLSAWKDEVDLAVAEMLRLVAGGGTVIIIGTPFGARDLFGHLESSWGFERRVFLTRWRFPSRRLARAAVRLFFGERAWRDYRLHWPKAMATLTGIWWRKS